ncbi:MAG: hypothetical protein LBB65_01165 [Burkholderiales bacterium]|jgi:hypothetical protein|nr:hypothetical protein [Burkholderiales bacterium]
MAHEIRKIIHGIVELEEVIVTDWNKEESEAHQERFRRNFDFAKVLSHVNKCVTDRLSHLGFTLGEAQKQIEDKTATAEIQDLAQTLKFITKVRNHYDRMEKRHSAFLVSVFNLGGLATQSMLQAHEKALETNRKRTKGLDKARPLSSKMRHEKARDRNVKLRTMAREFFASNPNASYRTAVSHIKSRDQLTLKNETIKEIISGAKKEAFETLSKKAK